SSIEDLKKFPNDMYISLNTSPKYIMNGAIERILANVPHHRIVLEITEHAPIEDYSIFREALKPLQEKGIRLAIDDAGAGYSSFQHILELSADIIKLDISLIRNIHLDTRRRALATALIAFAKAINCMMIAEGVECEEELLELRKLGVGKAQGYFIGHPTPVENAASLKIAV
ncbi:MAG: EAL domain-containing protein, partial [Oleibacter sp.]|nr:EAL domain-containing protein [Thalassolituus sp.]